MGVIIFLVLCLNVIGMMCGGSSSWGEWRLTDKSYMLWDSLIYWLAQPFLMTWLRNGRINLPTASSVAEVITEAIVTVTTMLGTTASSTMNATADIVRTTMMSGSYGTRIRSSIAEWLPLWGWCRCLLEVVSRIVGTALSGVWACVWSRPDRVYW